MESDCPMGKEFPWGGGNKNALELDRSDGFVNILLINANELFTSNG